MLVITKIYSVEVDPKKSDGAIILEVINKIKQQEQENAILRNININNYKNTIQSLITDLKTQKKKILARLDTNNEIKSYRIKKAIQKKIDEIKRKIKEKRQQIINIEKAQLFSDPYMISFQIYQNHTTKSPNNDAEEA